MHICLQIKKKSRCLTNFNLRFGIANFADVYLRVNDRKPFLPDVNAEERRLSDGDRENVLRVCLANHQITLYKQDMS